jgi:hypothetical protein
MVAHDYKDFEPGRLGMGGRKGEDGDQNQQEKCDYKSLAAHLLILSLGIVRTALRKIAI